MTTSSSKHTILSETKNSLPEKERAQICHLLQARLADSIDLTIQLKHAHWNVKGPDFMAIHLLFDQLAESSEENADLLAERIAQLGGAAQGTLATVSKNTSLPIYPLSNVFQTDHISSISNSLAVYANDTKKTITAVTHLADTVTVDILTQTLRRTDKSLWLMESHIQPPKENKTLGPPPHLLETASMAV